MYEDFFKLRSRPFLAAPQSSRFFAGAAIEQARQSLVRLVARGEGAGLIVGPPGTGKTLLCQLLVEHFQGEFAVALLTCGRLSTRQALLQAILYELHLPYQGLDEGELRLELLDYLEPKIDGHQGLLLLVDEAHTLGWKLLEEVRLISNLVRDGQSRVRVILSGSLALEERFAGPRLSSFSQRLAARCYLEPLASSETADYVRSQISAVGGDATRLFDTAALGMVYRATDGIPRLINQVCDHALILAFLGGSQRLTAEIVEEAWADLQQLPAPYSTDKRPASAGNVVEFGGLDEGLEDAPEAIPFPSSVAPLHVAAAEEQFEVIEDHLSHLDDDEELAGSVGTEVELAFPEFGDPFAEEFAEEEIVLERYGSVAEVFSRLPRVSSVEGHQLARRLQPLPTESETPVVEPPAKPLKVAPIVEEPAALADDAVNSESQQSVAEPEVKPPAPVLIYHEQPMDDRDLIVIEEPVGPRVAQPLPQQRSYRQLFARLRRG